MHVVQGGGDDASLSKHHRMDDMDCLHGLCGMVGCRGADAVRVHRQAGRAGGLRPEPQASQPVGFDPARLEAAAKALYSAGHWRCDRSVDESALWTELRDALGLKPGCSPATIAGDIK